MSGRCDLRRQQGMTLLGMLIAAALASLVFALSLTALITVLQGARTVEHRMSRAQDARWVLRLLARDLSAHGRLGCKSLPWLPSDFSAGEWRLRLPGRELGVIRALRVGDSLEGMQLMKQAPETWRQWRRVWLGSCGSGRMLDGSGAQWRGDSDAPELRLTPALPLSPREDGVHLPSMQLWLPRERRYRLEAVGRGYRLLVRDWEGGLSDGEERLVLDGVKRMELRLLERQGCGETARWSWRAPGSWPAGQVPQAARLSLEWYPDDRETPVSQLELELALDAAPVCGAAR
ncbi:PilW family protein [Chromobacterium phragmitis]|uniref:PilW family protein n=1 Tax=Chromobacterium phragmitis TaxID=2202141 RepID=UPI00143D97DF|nr:hypothetical protein [Chromobacterium phragmitis]